MRDLEAELLATRRPADPADVEAFLQVAGLRAVCGPDYIDFLMNYLEFHPAQGVVVSGVLNCIPGYSDEDGYLAMASIFTTSEKEHHNPYPVIDYYRDRIAPGSVPIGDDAYGNLFCMSVQEDTAGQIWFWTHDRGGPEDYSPETMHFVAKDFGDLLARLQVEARYGLTIQDPMSLGDRVDWNIPLDQAIEIHNRDWGGQDNPIPPIKK